jgi:hypothetical protein
MTAFQLQQEMPAQVAVGETVAPSHLPSVRLAAHGGFSVPGHNKQCSEFANLSFAATTNKTQQVERQRYENEKQGPQCNHRGDTIKMDAASADDVGAPRRRPGRDRLSCPTRPSPLSHPPS